MFLPAAVPGWQICDSGLERTFLRLAVASADALQWAFDVPGRLKEGDVVRGPWADAQVSPIHPADFAAVAIAALTDDERTCCSRPGRGIARCLRR